MSKQATGQYLRTQVLTAPPEQLHLMLYDGAIRFAEQGKAGLLEKDYEKTFNGISRAQRIVIELLNGLRQDVAPEICQQQAALYNFIYRRLMEANLEKNAAKLDDALEILRHQRQTWVLLMKKLTEQKGPDAATTSDGDQFSLAG